MSQELGYSAVFPLTHRDIFEETPAPDSWEKVSQAWLCQSYKCRPPEYRALRAWSRLTPGSKLAQSCQSCRLPPEAQKCDGKAWALKLGN